MGLLTLPLVSAHFRQTAGSWIVMEQLVMSLYRNYCCEDIFPSIQHLLFYCSWHYKFDCSRLVPQHFRLKGIQEDSVRAGSLALSAIRISESASVFFCHFFLFRFHLFILPWIITYKMFFCSFSFSWKRQDPSLFSCRDPSKERRNQHHCFRIFADVSLVTAWARKIKILFKMRCLQSPVFHFHRVVQNGTKFIQ